MNLWPPDFTSPQRVCSGAGCVARLPVEGARFGAPGLLVHGRSLARAGRLAAILAAAPEDCEITVWEHTGGEPELGDLERLLAAARARRVAWIAGVGGGSVLDLAKAAAGLFHCRREPAAYHGGAPLETPGLPFIAAPTTAGTGSEATPNAVLTNPAARVKKSIRDPALVARLVFLDPALLEDCPPAVMAHSGMDALTQSVEAFTSRHATWLSDVLALKSVELIAANLEPVFRGGTPAQRADLLQGSYLGGLAFALGRLGVVHGLAHPLGLRYHAPHGLVCGVCLPAAIELNREAMGAKYGLLGRAVGGDLLDWTRQALARLGMVSPFQGRPVPERDAIIGETLAAWSTQSNARPVTAADVAWLLDRLFGA